MGDYYPFGMVMPGRSFSSQSGYRYGFNGKQNDTESGSGGLTQDYGFRMYNPAIAKFLSVDPLAPEYPWYTPYQFAGNMPIMAVDLDGMEPRFPATSAYQVAEAPLIGSNDGVTHTWIANADKTWTWVCPEIQVADYRYDEGEMRGDKNGWTSIVWHQGGVVLGANVSEAGWYTFEDYERIIRTLAPKLDYLECGNPIGFNGDLLYGAETTESAYDEISTFFATREFCAEGSGDNYFDKALSDARTGYETTKGYKLTGSGYCEPIYCEDMFVGGAGLLRRVLAKGLAAGAAKGGTSLWPAASGGRTVVNGIEYTTHALERMQPVGTIMKGATSYSRGIPPSVVENAIKFGKVTPGNTAAEVVRTFENVRVITNPAGTRVISVFKIGD